MQFVVQYFIPADHNPPFRSEKILDTGDHIGLESLYPVKSLPLDQGLAFRTGRPGDFPGLVASDMDVFRREKLHNFGKHILHKSIYLFVADTKFSRRIRFARTAQLRIADEHGVGMRREFDLGNDRNVPLGGVGHDLTDVLFCEISAVSARSSLGKIATVVPVPPCIPIPLRAECPFGGEPRIFVDPDAPTTVIGQMEMEYVEFVAGHFVQHLQHLTFRKEMPRYIHVHAPVGKPGPVADPYARNTLVGHQLFQRPFPIENAGLGGGRESHRRAIDRKFVSLPSQRIHPGIVHNYGREVVHRRVSRLKIPGQHLHFRRARNEIHPNRFV